MKVTFLDKLVGTLSPQAAIRRLNAKAQLEYLQRSYDAAQTFQTDDWTSATKGSSNKEIKAALPVLRDKARDAIRNNPFALHGRDVIVSNTIGYGIVPNIKTKKANPKQVEAIREAWKIWGETTLCDVEGRRTYFGLQASAMAAIVESGEVIGNKVITKEDLVVASATGILKIKAAHKIQLLESDYIDSKVDDDKTAQGVEIDNLGKPLAYWLFEQHPGDKESKSKKTDAINIVHVFKSDRPGQRRGVSWFHAVIRRLEDLKNYQEATLIRQKIAACYAVFITSADDQNTMSAATQRSKLEQEAMIEPGLMKRLAPGESVQLSSPPGVENYDGYCRQTLREVSAGLGITFEEQANDYSQSNFSSSRMSKMGMNKNVDMWRWNMIVPQFCEPTFKWFLEWCDMALGLDIEGIYADWTPPAREFIDPGSEIEAIKKAIRTGIKTLPEAIREQGYDPETFFAEVQKSNEQMDAMGLAFDSDPRKMSAVGFAQAGDSFDKLQGIEPTDIGDTTSEQSDQKTAK